MGAQETSDKKRTLDSTEVLGTPSRLELVFLWCQAGCGGEAVHYMAPTRPQDTDPAAHQSQERSKSIRSVLEGVLCSPKNPSERSRRLLHRSCSARRPGLSVPSPRLFARRSKGLSCVSWKLSRTVLRGRDRSNPVLSLGTLVFAPIPSFESVPLFSAG